MIDKLEKHLPFQFLKLHRRPNGRFPNGIPNPMLPEYRVATAEVMSSSGADFGVVWDGDFDPCFFFDEMGRFIEGYYLVGLLAAQMLAKHPGGRIIHDPRLTWNTIDMVRTAGGEPIQSKTGHAFIKERMRAEDAIYGGEMSSHHCFRSFAYCDSGMIPWLLVAERICHTGQPLSTIVDSPMQAYPCSGEINFEVADTAAAIECVLSRYTHLGPKMDHTDGVSAEFADWRFNLRASNTEPLLRLNVESRGDTSLVKVCTEEFAAIIRR